MMLSNPDLRENERPVSVKAISVYASPSVAKRNESGRRMAASSNRWRAAA
jgi:hypothetical protein